MNSFTARHALMASAAIMCTVAAMPAVAQEKSFDIPALDARSGISAFGRQADVQIAASRKVTAGKRTNAVRGAMEVDRALQALLSGTGLAVRSTGPQTFTVVNGASIVAGPAAIAGESNAGSVAADSESAQDIIVTAQKKEQNLQSVPEAIQVLSGQQLIRQGANSINDFVNKIPGLTIVGGGDPGTGKAVIRGISTGSDRGGVVGVYVDDIAVSAVSPLALTTGFVFDPDLSDVDRVEVLKGPQSTLYGASAVGGVIHFVTKRPSLTTTSSLLRADADSVTGGGEGYGVRAYVNTPLVDDKIALSISAFYRRTAGFTDNVLTQEKDVNHAVSGGTRAALRMVLSDALETTFSGIYQNIKVADQTLIDMNPAGNPRFGRTSFSRIFPIPIRIRYRLASNTTTADLGFATVTNIAAYTHQRNASASDFSSLAAIAPGATYISYDNANRTKRFTDELRLSSAPGRLEWLLAGYYLRERNSNTVLLRGVDAAGNELPATSPGFDVYTFNTASVFTEKAVFGNMTYHFTPQIEATVGARYSSNSQSFNVVRSGILGRTPVRPGQAKDSSVTYLATVSYTPVAEMTLFARAASAYRPGSTQVLGDAALAAGIEPVYKADTLWNYEVGVKGSLADARVSYEASLFYMDWKDIQFGAIINNFSYIQNAGKARSKGGEATIGFRPFRGLSTSLRAAYTEAKILVDIPAVGARSGDVLPNSAKWNVAASVDYRIATSGPVTPTVGASYTYRSSAPSGFANGLRFTLPSYSTLDLRAGIEWRNLIVDLHVDNVTNEYGLTSGTFATGGVVIRPRRYGVGVEVRY